MIALVNYPYNPNNMYNRNQLGSVGTMPWVLLALAIVGMSWLGTKRSGKLF